MIHWWFASGIPSFLFLLWFIRSAHGERVKFDLGELVLLGICLLAGPILTAPLLFYVMIWIVPIIVEAIGRRIRSVKS